MSARSSPAARPRPMRDACSRTTRPSPPRCPRSPRRGRLGWRERADRHGGAMKPAVVAAGAAALAVLTPVLAHGADAVPVVKTPGGVSLVVNQYIKDSVHFSPGHIQVRSGGNVTFRHTTKENEPHTVTVSTAADLPKKESDFERCKPCRIASKHLKNPKDENSGVAHVILNKGPAGLDEEGDSVALEPKKSVTIAIAAPAGTTLHFMCAVRPWMQGTSTVTSPPAVRATQPGAGSGADRARGAAP